MFSNFKAAMRLFTLLLFIISAHVSAESFTLAVASNFQQTAKQLRTTFSEQHAGNIHIVSASSGKLYAQISHGAPYDIFLSADQDKPKKLQALGFVSDMPPLTYAIGQLVLWSADVTLDVENCLKNHCYEKIALANPRHAPYGIAAREAINNLQLKSYSVVHEILGENINQTFQFIATKNVKLGFIAAAQSIYSHTQMGRNYWLVPQDLYTPIYQDGVLLKHGEKNSLAQKFWNFLQTNEAQKIISSSGFTVNQQQVIR